MMDIIDFSVTVLIALALIVAYIAWYIYQNSNPTQNPNPPRPPITFHFNCPGPPNLMLYFDGNAIKDSNQQVYHKKYGGPGNIAYYWCQKNHHKNLPVNLVPCKGHFHLDEINNVVVKHVHLIYHNHP